MVFDNFEVQGLIIVDEAGPSGLLMQPYYSIVSPTFN
jgi:hypothetical protein